MSAICLTVAEGKGREVNCAQSSNFCVSSASVSGLDEWPGGASTRGTGK